jgi:hypothetical protein
MAKSQKTPQELGEILHDLNNRIRAFAANEIKDKNAREKFRPLKHELWLIVKELRGWV